MRLSALELLVCPVCRGDLKLAVSERQGDEVVSGWLGCGACAGRFAIRGGVPRLLSRPPAAGLERRLLRRFGWQAERFPGTAPAAGAVQQLLDFFDPAGVELAGRTVAEVGCGSGRWALAASAAGARQVVAIDRSDAVDVAWRLARARPNVHVVQADIQALPLPCGTAARLDLAFSIGVLHHLADPAGAVHALAQVVRPGGVVHSWVYAAEHRSWPVRAGGVLRDHLTARLPAALTCGLAFGLTTVVHPFARLLGRRGGYPGVLARRGFAATHAVLHDYLATPRTRHVARTELLAWFEAAGLPRPAITLRNGNSWRAQARRPEPPAAGQRPPRLSSTQSPITSASRPEAE